MAIRNYGSAIPIDTIHVDDPNKEEVDSKDLMENRQTSWGEKLRKHLNEGKRFGKVFGFCSEIYWHMLLRHHGRILPEKVLRTAC